MPALQGNSRNTHICIAYNLLKNRRQHYEADKNASSGSLTILALLNKIQDIFLVRIPNTKIICVH